MGALLLVFPFSGAAVGGATAELLERYGFSQEYASANERRRETIRRYIAAREAAQHGPPPEPSSGLPDLERIEATSRSWFDGAAFRWNLSAGALPQTPVLGRSPYAAVEGELSGSGERLDYLLRGRLGAASLDARFVPPSPYDPAVPDDGSRAQSRTIFTGGLLAQTGRAAHLFGPFDVGAGVLGLLRVTDAFPNASFDESVGLRLRSGEHSTALFTGTTQSLSLLSADWARRALAGERAAEATVESSPHVGLSLWGPLGLARDATYSVLGRVQNNELTQERSLAGEAAVPYRDGRLSVFGRYERREGSEIEYDRKKSSLGAGYTTRGGLGVSLEAVRDSASYGSADMERNYVMLGLSWTGRSGSLTLSAPEASSFRDRSQPTGAAALATALDTELGRLDQVLVAAQAALSGVSDQELWLAFQVAYETLDPEMRASLEAEAGGRAGLQAGLLLAADYLRSDQGRNAVAALRDLLVDPQRFDRALTRYMRAEAAKALGDIEISAIGGTTRLDPPAMLALLNAYSLGAEPLPPVRARDISGAAADRLDALLAGLDAETRARLQLVLGPDSTAAAGAAAQAVLEVVRRELNGILLQAILAAESLDTLSVNRGLRPGEVHADALRRSFGYLDARRAEAAAPPRPSLERIARRLTEERAAADRRLQELLYQRAHALARRLEPVGIAAPPQAWAPMLALYGEIELDVFLREAARQMSGAGPARLLVDFRPDLDYGPVIERGSPPRITLPGALGRREPASVLRAGLAALQRR